MANRESTLTLSLIDSVSRPARDVATASRPRDLSGGHPPYDDPVKGAASKLNRPLESDCRRPSLAADKPLFLRLTVRHVSAFFLAYQRRK